MPVVRPLQEMLLLLVRDERNDIEHESRKRIFRLRTPHNCAAPELKLVCTYVSNQVVDTASSPRLRTVVAGRIRTKER